MPSMVVLESVGAFGSVVHCCMQDVERIFYVEIGFIDNGYTLATSVGYCVGCPVHNLALRASLSGTFQTAKFSYATEGVFFISTQLSTDAVSIL